MKTSFSLLLSFLIAPFADGAVVKAFEFESATDLNEWNTALTLNTTGLAVSGGTINGTASGNDPQLRIALGGLTPSVGETWSTVEFRVRETEDLASGGGVVAFNNIGIVVAVSGTGAGTFPNSATAVASGDGFYTVTQDISSFGSGAITTFRVDPIGGASSNSNSQTADNVFEVDYIRISDTSVIPEPSSWSLFALGTGLVALRRRR